MAKTIDTLADDINALLGTGTHEQERLEERLTSLGVNIAMHTTKSLAELKPKERPPKTLYMSEVGKPCHRQLWYDFHSVAGKEPLAPNVLYKFLFGDIVEETTLFLAEVAGHRVEQRQERVAWTHKDWTIQGYQDAVIDGVLVDVKSCSPFALSKFKTGLNDDNDSFGYRTQLSGYNGPDSPRYKEQGFLAVDKLNGHIHYAPSEWSDPRRVIEVVVGQLESPLVPKRRYAPIESGASGNKKLGVECSYCPHKYTCHADANGGRGLKAFGYSYGPEFLVEIKRMPKVPELERV